MWAAPGTGAGEAEPEELDMITQRHFAGMFLFNWEIPNHYSPVGTGSNRFMIVYRGSKHAAANWEIMGSTSTQHTPFVVV